MTLGDQIRRGALWLFGGQIANRALEFGIGIVLARLLAPADFGAVSIVYVFTGLVGLVAGGGLGQALVRSESVDDCDCQVIFTAQLAIGIVIFLTLYAIAPLVGHAYGDVLLRDLLRVSAVSFLFRPLGNLPSALLSREMRFGAQTISKATSLLIYGITAVFLAMHGFGPWALVLGSLATMPVHYVMLRSFGNWPAGLCFEIGRWRRHAGIGLRFSLNDLADYARERTPTLIIGRLAGTGPLGLFNRGYSLSRMPIGLVSGSLYQPLFRALSAEQQNLDRSRYLYRRFVTVASIYSFPVAAVLAITAPEFVVTLFGEKWAGSAPLLRLFCLLAPLHIVANASGAVIAAQARLGEEVRIHLVALVLVAIGTTAGLQFGLYGAIAAVGASLMYVAVAAARLAADALRAPWWDAFGALLPALPVTTACSVAALLARMLMPEALWSEGLRLLMLAAVPAGAGLLAAVATLLLAPVPALASERARWRGLLTAPFQGRTA